MPKPPASIEASRRDLENRLRRLEADYQALERTSQARIQELERQCELGRRNETALDMAQVIVDNSPVILFRRLAGDDPRLVYVSDNIRRLGYTPSDFLEERIRFRDIVHPDDQDRVSEEIQGFRERDVENYTQYYRILDREGGIRWIEDRTTVVRDAAGRKQHHQGILVDITERRIAEEALRKSEEKYRRIIETTGQGVVMMDGDFTIVDVNDAYCRMLGYSRDELIGRSPFDLATDAFRRFMETNRERLLASEVRKFEGDLVTKSGSVVPVLIHGNTLRDDRGARLGNVALVTDLTTQKQSLMLAAEIQRNLMPQNSPQMNGLDIAGRSVPCDEIGGDYFDFIADGNPVLSPFCVVVGDITGHGVDAALFMTASRSFLRLRASQPGTAHQIVSDMNRHLASDTDVSGRFMTLFFMVVDPERQRIRWVRAGHEPAVVYDPSKDRFDELKGRGIALGVDPEFPYEENEYRDLAPGQIIAIGTDGIWEARNPDGEMFGKARMLNIIRKERHRGAEAILSGVYQELDRFMDGNRSEDDMTLVIAKATPPVGV